MSRSTCSRKSLSPSQASSRNAMRSFGPRVIASSNRSVIRCHSWGSINFLPWSALRRATLWPLPVSHDRVGMYLKDAGNLFYGQSAEVTHFDDLASATIKLGQLFHRFIQRQHLLSPLFGDQSRLVQGNPYRPGAAFQRMPCTRVIHHDATH